MGAQKLVKCYVEGVRDAADIAESIADHKMRLEKRMAAALLVAGSTFTALSALLLPLKAGEAIVGLFFSGILTGLGLASLTEYVYAKSLHRFWAKFIARTKEELERYELEGEN